MAEGQPRWTPGDRPDLVGRDLVPFFEGGGAVNEGLEGGVSSSIGVADIQPRKWNSEGYFEEADGGAEAAAAPGGMNPLVAAMMRTSAGGGGSNDGGINPLVAAMLAGGGALPAASSAATAAPRTPPRVVATAATKATAKTGSPRFAWSTFQSSPAPSAVPIPSWHRGDVERREASERSAAAAQAAQAEAVVQSGGLESMLKNMLGVRR